MITEVSLSRRSLLRGASLSLALPPLEAMQNTQVTTVSTLLDGSGLVRIPAGSFSMGSAQGNADEQPVHQVRISRSFEMSKFEVTQGQWESVMIDPHASRATVKAPDGVEVSSTPSHFKGKSRPVENVSWDDLQLFLTRLNERDSAHLFRLPTEAEWEYACNAGRTGDDAKNNLDSMAWHKANSDSQTQPVGLKQPNAWGLYDMLGNVAEWVQDWYGWDYYRLSPKQDPPGPSSGSYRVYRGGGWFDDPLYCRAAFRGFESPNSRLRNVGFRLVRRSR